MKKILALALALALLCPALSALAEKTIKIGIFEPMTGAMEKEGFDLANELYPEVLGKKIELIYGDNKSDRAEATLAAQSLVDKGVVAVLGSYASGLTMAGSEVFAEEEIPALTATATNPTVTLDCEWYARICFIDPFQGTMLARYAVKNEYKKIAIMREKDFEYAVGLVKYFQDELANHEGFEVIEVCDFMNKDEDFSALLGMLAERLAYRPLRSAPRISILVSAIGVSYFLQNLSRTYDILMIVVMGGMGSISGSVVAAFLVTIGQEWLRALDGPLPFLPFWPENGVSGMRMVVFSILLLIVILFFRNGLFGHREITWSAIGRRLSALAGHRKDGEVKAHE